MDVQKAIKQYYELKQEYNEQINQIKSRIRSMDLLSSAEKKQKYALTEKKCVNCGQSGGTLFKETNFTLKAVCGNPTSPCKLNINIYKGEYLLSNELSKMYYDDMKKTQRNIIKSKLDMIFEYIDEETLLNKFNDMKKELVENKKMYDFFQQIYLKVISSKEKKDKTEELVKSLDENIKDLRDKMIIYEDDEIQNMDLLKECINIYTSKISPLNKMIRDINYSYMRMETCDERMCDVVNKYSTFFLTQKKYDIVDLEQDIGEEKPHVISFEK